MLNYIGVCLQCKGFSYHEPGKFLCVECEHQYIAIYDRKIEVEKEYQRWLRKILPRPCHFADNMRRALIHKKHGVWVKPYSTDEVNPDVD